MSEPQDDRWQPVPVPLGDGRHDVGDAVRAAIAQRLIEDFGRLPELTPQQVHHLALFAAASVRSLLHELGTLRDMSVLVAAPVPRLEGTAQEVGTPFNISTGHLLVCSFFMVTGGARALNTTCPIHGNRRAENSHD
jgi:hypothetical protein